MGFDEVSDKVQLMDRFVLLSASGVAKHLGITKQAVCAGIKTGRYKPLTRLDNGQWVFIVLKSKVAKELVEPDGVLW